MAQLITGPFTAEVVVTLDELVVDEDISVSEEEVVVEGEVVKTVLEPEPEPGVGTVPPKDKRSRTCQMP